MNLRVTGIGRIGMGRNLGEKDVNPSVVYEILKNLKSGKKEMFQSIKGYKNSPHTNMTRYRVAHSILSKYSTAWSFIFML